MGSAIEYGKNRRRLIEVHSDCGVLYRGNNIATSVERVEILRRGAQLEICEPVQQAEVGREVAAGINRQIVEREHAVGREPDYAAILELDFCLAVLTSGQLDARKQGQIELCGFARSIVRLTDSDRALKVGQASGATCGVGACGRLEAKNREADSQGEQKKVLQRSTGGHRTASVGNPYLRVPPPPISQDILSKRVRSWYIPLDIYQLGMKGGLPRSSARH
jgi:hypothetical protein